MTTAPGALKQLSKDWETAIASAVCSGIVGDRQHHRGYHRGADEVPVSDYSRQLPGDRNGIDPAASGALDMSMSRADMRLVTGRLYRSYRDPGDPRLDGWREIIGTLDGKAVIYIDLQKHEIGSADKSHLTHVHVGGLRCNSNDPDVMHNLLSVVKGRTVEQWRGKPAAKPPATKPTPRVAPPHPPAPPHPHPSAPPFPGRVVRLRVPRMKGNDVLAWQRQMKSRGWAIETDSVFGPHSEALLKQFQRNHKLPADGVLGPMSWSLAWSPS